MNPKPIVPLKSSLALTATFLLCQACATTPQPHTPIDLLAEAQKIAPGIGEAAWPGLGQGQFRVLLIDGDVERLYCAETTVPEEFKPAGRDNATGCSVHERAQNFRQDFLAAFPLSDGVPTIIVGTPEATGKSDAEWVTILFHELFHIRQYESANYFQRVRELRLDGGDQTGNWMLNYEFPYDDPIVGEAFSAMANAAANALEARGTLAFNDRLDLYRDTRSVFASSISADDLTYYDFQAWQEGTALFVEHKVKAMWDRHPATTDSLDRDLVVDLRSISLSERKRIAFYSIGAAEAAMLEARDPDWASDYYSGPLSLGARF